MNIQITSKNIEVSEGLRDFINKKAQSLEKRFSPISQFNVVLEVVNLAQMAEGTIHVQGTELHAHAEDEDMYKSIELLIEKLLAQITKHKDKLLDKQHHRT